MSRQTLGKPANRTWLYIKSQLGTGLASVICTIGVWISLNENTATVNPTGEPGLTLIYTLASGVLAWVFISRLQPFHYRQNMFSRGRIMLIG